MVRPASAAEAAAGSVQDGLRPVHARSAGGGFAGRIGFPVSSSTGASSRPTPSLVPSTRIQPSPSTLAQPFSTRFTMMSCPGRRLPMTLADVSGASRMGTRAECTTCHVVGSGIALACF